MLGFILSPAGAAGVCVCEALAPPVQIEAALLLTGGRQGVMEGGVGDWEPRKIPMNHEGLLAEHISRTRGLNKSRKKGSERKIISENEKEFIKVILRITFLPRVLRGDNDRVLMRSHECLWK